MTSQNAALKPEHLRFLEAWMRGYTVKDAAAEAGVDRSTAGKWLADPKHPVSIEWARRCEEATRRAALDLRSLTETAVDTLRDVLVDRDVPASARVAAVREVLGRAGLAETTRQEVAVESTPDALAEVRAMLRDGVDADALAEALEE